MSDARISPWWMAPPAALFVVFFLAQFATQAPSQNNEVYKPSLVLGSIAQDAVFIGYVVVAARTSGAGAAELGLRRVPLWPAAGLAAAVLFGVFVFDLVLEPLTSAGRKQGIAPTHTPNDQRQLLVLGLAVVAFAVVAPVAEELLFRGLGMATLGRYAPPLTAALFALAHLLPAVLPSVFVAGLLLAWLRLRTRSLLPGVAVHMALNAVGLAIALATARVA